MTCDHRAIWFAAFMSLGFLGSHCGKCGQKRFFGGYGDRRDRIVERLNKTWRVR